jgi:hypothetical protein
MMSQRILMHPHGTYSFTHKPVLLTKCVEAREEQLQPRQMLYVVSRAMPFFGGTMNERKVNAASPPCSRNDLVNTQNDRDLRVHVERSIVLDTNPEDSASIENGTNTPPKSDSDTGCTV